MGLNGSIEGSNPSFSASAAPAAVLRPPAEGWQSGRMRRSRKPLSVVRRIESSNLSPSAPSVPRTNPKSRVSSWKSRKEPRFGGARGLALDDALDLVALLARSRPDRLERAAIRWHGRLEVESQMLTIAE